MIQLFRLCCRAELEFDLVELILGFFRVVHIESLQFQKELSFSSQPLALVGDVLDEFLFEVCCTLTRGLPFAHPFVSFSCFIRTISDKVTFEIAQNFCESFEFLEVDVIVVDNIVLTHLEELLEAGNQNFEVALSNIVAVTPREEIVTNEEAEEHKVVENALTVIGYLHLRFKSLVLQVEVFFEDIDVDNLELRSLEVTGLRYYHLL